MKRVIPCLLVLVPTLVSDGGKPESGLAWGAEKPSTVDSGHSPLAGRSPFAGRSPAPGGVIELSYELPGAGLPGAGLPGPALPGAAAGVVGQPFEVRLRVSSAFAFTSLRMHVYAHDGLVITPPNWSAADPGAHEAVERSLTVTPYRQGALRFSVLVLGEVDGRIQAAQLTVPVYVGNSHWEPALQGR